MRVGVNPGLVRSAFAAVAGMPAFLESTELVADGELPVEMLQAMSLRPEILQAFGATGPAVYPGGLLERTLKERVILESSRANSCQFCTSSHISIMKQLGIADPIGSLDDDSALSERDKLALDYTRAAMRDSNRVPDELFERLKCAFTDPEIVELTFLIGLINLLNLFNNCLQIAYNGEFDASH